MVSEVVICTVAQNAGVVVGVAVGVWEGVAVIRGTAVTGITHCHITNDQTNSPKHKTTTIAFFILTSIWWE